jgi:hypothetical protein
VEKARLKLVSDTKIAAIKIMEGDETDEQIIKDICGD